MKKTVWNASLEESLNLVTDKYIQTSLEDIEKNGYGKKILGFLTVEFFIFLISFIGPYSDKEVGKILFVEAKILFSIPVWLGLLVIVHYLMDARKIRHNRILSYYYFNRNMFLMVSLLNYQVFVLCAIGSAMFFGSLIAVILNLSIIIFVIAERYLWFKKEVLNGLYGNQSVSNPLNDVLEKFVVLGRKYGGLIVFPFVVLRLFLPNQGKGIYENDFLRSLVMIFGIGGPILLFYFIVAIVFSCIQGFYINKYMEDYRILSGYSIEDWYGKKSKRYKESLGK
ncbi:hypothetical protein [Streptococcus suis]|uniref:hypothetical protein n=1 Tax=Streptococcus suis TaxID=1307 RepID=UPI000CF54822|nr:hypothetical protein [Streptococcus suis]